MSQRANGLLRVPILASGQGIDIHDREAGGLRCGRQASRDECLTREDLDGVGGEKEIVPGRCHGRV